MAYNILKGDVQFVNSTSGTIESMVDDHTSQTIGGIKTFSGIVNTSAGLSSSVFISASSFHGDGADLANVVAGGVSVSNAGNNRVVTSTATTALNAEQNMQFNGSTLSVMGDISASINVSGTAFYGAATGLTSIPATQLNGNVSAANIAFDANTLANNSGNLQVNLSSASGLESTVTGIRINASLATVKSSPEDNDKFIISDSGAGAGNAPKYMLYSVISAAVASGISTFPPNGNNGEVQFKNGSAFQGNTGLVYTSATTTLTAVNLTASGHISSSNYYGDGSKLSGLSTTTYGSFTSDFGVVPGNDGFLGIVTTGSAITASLPSAAMFSPGKRITFKDILGGCSGSTNHIVISASLNSSGESIDGQGILKIQAAYGSVTIVSDGLSQYYIESVN